MTGAPRTRRLRRSLMRRLIRIAVPGTAHMPRHSPRRQSRSNWSGRPLVPVRGADSRRPLRSWSERRRSRLTRPAAPTASWKPPPASNCLAPRGEAGRLLARAGAGRLGALDRARLKLLHGQTEVDLSRGVRGLPLVLDAARQLEPLDITLSREAYLAALRA